MEVAAGVEKEHSEANMSSSSSSEDEERARERRRHRRKRGQGYPSAFSAIPNPFMELPGSGMPTVWPGGNSIAPTNQGFPPHAAPFFHPPQPSAEYAPNPCSSTLLQQPCAAGQEHTWPAAPLHQVPSYAAPAPLAAAPCMPPSMPLQMPMSSAAPLHPQDYARPHPHCCSASAPLSTYPQGYTHTNPSAPPAYPQGYTHANPAAALPAYSQGYTHANPAAAPPACSQGYTHANPAAVLPAYSQGYTHANPAAVPPAVHQQLGCGAAAASAAPQCSSTCFGDPSCHTAPPAGHATLLYPLHPHPVHAHAQSPHGKGARAWQGAWQQPQAPPPHQQLGLSTLAPAPSAAAAAASRGGRQVAELQGELHVRRTQLAQQLARLSSHCAEVQASAADQAQQVTRLAQDLQDRVHSVEAMQLAALDEGKSRVAQELTELDALLDRMAAALASDSAAGLSLLLQAPVLLEEATHIMGKPLPEQPHLPPPPMDVVRSYAQLYEAHSALEQLLEVKDHMISHLLQERDALKDKLKEQAEDNAQMLRQHCARLSSELGNVKRERPGHPSSSANPANLRRQQGATDRSVVHDLISELAEKSKQLLSRASNDG